MRRGAAGRMARIFLADKVGGDQSDHECGCQDCEDQSTSATTGRHGSVEHGEAPWDNRGSGLAPHTCVVSAVAINTTTRPDGPRFASYSAIDPGVGAQSATKEHQSHAG